MHNATVIRTQDVRGRVTFVSLRARETDLRHDPRIIRCEWLSALATLATLPLFAVDIVDADRYIIGRLGGQ